MEDLLGLVVIIGFFAYVKRDFIMAKFKEFKEKK